MSTRIISQILTPIGKTLLGPNNYFLYPNLGQNRTSQSSDIGRKSTLFIQQYRPVTARQRQRRPSGFESVHHNATLVSPGSVTADLGAHSPLLVDGWVEVAEIGKTTDCLACTAQFALRN